MEKYEWFPTVCAPKGYPVQVHEGAFYSGNEWTHLPGKGVVDQGWGVSGNVMIIAPYLKHVPERLVITWLSFTENKFYSGDFKLDTEKIATLFSEGGITRYTKEKETYIGITVGLAPGGIVVVWLSGLGRIIDVGRYRAEEVELDWKKFNPSGIQDRNLYVRSSISDDFYMQLQEKGIPYGLWDKYRKRFKTKLVIRYDQHIKVKTDCIRISFYNGERDYLYNDRLDNLDFESLAWISAMDIDWTFDSQQYEAQLRFDEDNIFSAYQEAWSEHTNFPVEIIIIINRGNDEVEVFFENKDRKIIITPIKAKIYLNK